MELKKAEKYFVKLLREVIRSYRRHNTEQVHEALSNEAMDAIRNQRQTVLIVQLNDIELKKDLKCTAVIMSSHA